MNQAGSRSVCVEILNYLCKPVSPSVGKEKSIIAMYSLSESVAKFYSKEMKWISNDFQATWCTNLKLKRNINSLTCYQFSSVLALSDTATAGSSIGTHVHITFSLAKFTSIAEIAANFNSLSIVERYKNWMLIIYWVWCHRVWLSKTKSGRGSDTHKPINWSIAMTRWVLSYKLCYGLKYIRGDEFTWQEFSGLFVVSLQWNIVLKNSQ